MCVCVCARAAPCVCDSWSICPPQFLKSIPGGFRSQFHSDCLPLRTEAPSSFFPVTSFLPAAPSHLCPSYRPLPFSLGLGRTTFKCIPAGVNHSLSYPPKTIFSRNRLFCTSFEIFKSFASNLSKGLILFPAFFDRFGPAVESFPEGFCLCPTNQPQISSVLGEKHSGRLSRKPHQRAQLSKDLPQGIEVRY